MELKVLEKVFDYLPVIVATCDRYGWCGGRGTPIPRSAIPDARTFFEGLRSKIHIKEIPELEDVSGSLQGGISFLWETQVDPIKYTYDSFELIFYGEGIIGYTASLESLGILTKGGFLLEEGVDTDTLQNMKFFKRKQDEQREIQKLTAPESSANKCLQ